MGRWFRPAGGLAVAGRRDNDLTRFLIYLVAAVRTVAPSIGEALLGVLESPQPPHTESFLIALLNEIATTANDFVLVIDDFHVVDAKPIDTALTFLLEHLPPQMRLVIVTREDPQLPLARLRGGGQLSELRVADLRFTPSEGAGFLNEALRALHIIGGRGVVKSFHLQPMVFIPLAGPAV